MVISAFIPGLGHIVGGRTLTGAPIMLFVFPAVLGCGIGFAGLGRITGGPAFVGAAIVVPVVYLSIILDWAARTGRVAQ